MEYNAYGTYSPSGGRCAWHKRINLQPAPPRSGGRSTQACCAFALVERGGAINVIGIKAPHEESGGGVSRGAAASLYLRIRPTSIQRERAQTRVGGEVVSRLRVRWVMYPGGGPHETICPGGAQGSREMGGHRGQIAPVGHPHPPCGAARSTLEGGKSECPNLGARGFLAW